MNIGVGVGIIILKDGKILLGKRNSDEEKTSSLLNGAGKWTLPGGKLHFGESFEEAAEREVFEETGIKIKDTAVICINNDIVEDAHFVTIGLLCENFEGEPEIKEDSITEWNWFLLNEIPEPLYFPTKKVLDNYLKKKFYIKKEKLLYLDDSYLKEFDAKVVKVENNKVILNQTAFYPESGGQPADNGKIICNNIEYNVIDVKKEKGEVIHYVDKEGLNVNDKVKGTIDWEKRYKLMKMHTAAHILSAIINKMTGALITGNQLGIDKSRIDFDLEEFNREELKDYFNAANDVVKFDLAIKSYTVKREEAEADGNLCKLAKGLPSGLKELRIVEIDIFDKQPDGGTHVAWTGEIGKIIFLDAENKGANNRRVYFGLE